ncbi:Leucine-rich_repeat [Hexamita inflata]|uniref:Leucine-rich repeat n=1 Tax=Hexamita inflata TaxID=28002 RepID=A0AA86V309_9EUKA|nr:Leucine-rich repeat [Hexamita inflata]
MREDECRMLNTIKYNRDSRNSSQTVFELWWELNGLRALNKLNSLYLNNNKVMDLSTVDYLKAKGCFGNGFGTSYQTQPSQAVVREQIQFNSRQLIVSLSKYKQLIHTQKQLLQFISKLNEWVPLVLSYRSLLPIAVVRVKNALHLTHNEGGEQGQPKAMFNNLEQPLVIQQSLFLNEDVFARFQILKTVSSIFQFDLFFDYNSFICSVQLRLFRQIVLQDRCVVTVCLYKSEYNQIFNNVVQCGF